MSTEHTLIRNTSKNRARGFELCAVESGGLNALNLYELSHDHLEQVYPIAAGLKPTDLEKLAVRLLQIASYADPELNIEKKYNIDSATLSSTGLEL